MVLARPEPTRRRSRTGILVEAFPTAADNSTATGPNQSNWPRPSAHEIVQPT